MIKLTERQVILSIESAVQGGSLSILANGSEIESWSGTLNISKAEDILQQIDRLLRENRIDKNQIKLIVTSKDVGSSTGQKIGSALAKGLCKSLKCVSVEISVMEALLREVKECPDGKFVTAVANGRNYIWWQVFVKQNCCFDETTYPQISTFDDFYRHIKENSYSRIVFSFDSAVNNDSQLFTSSIEEKGKFVISGKNLATVIGLMAISNASDNGVIIM